MRLVALALFLLYAAPDEWAEFRRLSKDRDPDRRCEAVALIRPRADRAMVEALLPLLNDPHARVRKRAGEAVGRVASPDGVEFLAKAGLRHLQPRVRRHAAAALGAIRDPATVTPLLAALADPDAEVRAAAAAALARLDAVDAVAKVTSLAERDPSWLARTAAIEALAELDRAAADRVATLAASDRLWQVRLAAAIVAPALDPETGLAVFAKSIADPDWRVRVQAMESACVLRVRAVIGPIIDQFTKEAGRLRWDAWLALKDLTGKELPPEPAPWKRWWEANRESFDPPPAAPPGAPPVRPSGETGVSFFSVPILSTRLAFVLDLSGSMRDPAPPEPGRAAETKLDLAKREMNRTFGRLPEGVWFNVLLLGCGADGEYDKQKMAWKRTLQPATPRGRAEAAAFLNRQEGRGWTNLWDGIELAFEDDHVDTIYLYTDGGASRGVFVATADILDELAAANRYRKIMIHTVEVPAEKPNTADNIKLLKRLAETTKGNYRLSQ